MHIKTPDRQRENSITAPSPDGGDAPDLNFGGLPVEVAAEMCERPGHCHLHESFLRMGLRMTIECFKWMSLAERL